jgi:maleylpyruvate isomerase
MNEQQRRQLDSDVAGCAGSHQALLRTLDDLVTGAVVESERPSLLPGWTLGHVLTHLARNGDAFRHMIEGAAAGEVRTMYATAETRDLAIAAGAARPLGEIVDDVRRSVWALESSWAALDAEGWAGFGLTRMGQIPVTQFPWRRWREVSVHWVDLGIGYEPDNWPVDYVEADFARRIAEQDTDAHMPDDVTAGSRARQLAWLLGRQSGFVAAPPEF